MSEPLYASSPASAATPAGLMDEAAASMIRVYLPTSRGSLDAAIDFLLAPGSIGDYQGAPTFTLKRIPRSLVRRDMAYVMVDRLAARHMLTMRPEYLLGCPCGDAACQDPLLCQAPPAAPSAALTGDVQMHDDTSSLMSATSSQLGVGLGLLQRRSLNQRNAKGYVWMLDVQGDHGAGGDDFGSADGDSDSDSGSVSSFDTSKSNSLFITPPPARLDYHPLRCEIAAAAGDIESIASSAAVSPKIVALPSDAEEHDSQSSSIRGYLQDAMGSSIIPHAQDHDDEEDTNSSGDFLRSPYNRRVFAAKAAVEDHDSHHDSDGSDDIDFAPWNQSTSSATQTDRPESPVFVAPPPPASPPPHLLLTAARSYADAATSTTVDLNPELVPIPPRESLFSPLAMSFADSGTVRERMSIMSVVITSTELDPERDNGDADVDEIIEQDVEDAFMPSPDPKAFDTIDSAPSPTPSKWKRSLSKKNPLSLLSLFDPPSLRSKDPAAMVRQHAVQHLRQQEQGHLTPSREGVIKRLAKGLGRLRPHSWAAAPSPPVAPPPNKRAQSHRVSVVSVSVISDLTEDDIDAVLRLGDAQHLLHQSRDRGRPILRGKRSSIIVNDMSAVDIDAVLRVGEQLQLQQQEKASSERQARRTRSKPPTVFRRISQSLNGRPAKRHCSPAATSVNSAPSIASSRARSKKNGTTRSRFAFWKKD
ncbi:hypothetical protein RI367_006771 [Sorochytrium milnesiophthora]